MMSRANTVDRAYFEGNKSRLEYVREPLAGEFGDLEVPADARVRVFLINPRSLVKVLELPDGTRLATVMETQRGDEWQQRVA